MELELAEYSPLPRTRTGHGNYVTLKIRTVPILYLPYISFPLTDKRKSGFLFPVIGSSEKTGIQAGILLL